MAMRVIRKTFREVPFKARAKHPLSPGARAPWFERIPPDTEQRGARLLELRERAPVLHGRGAKDALKVHPQIGAGAKPDVCSDLFDAEL
jgi:hypothetical protein